MDFNHKTGLQGAIVLTVLHFILSSYLLYKKKGDEEWKWFAGSVVILLTVLVLLIIDYTKHQKVSPKTKN